MPQVCVRSCHVILELIALSLVVAGCGQNAVAPSAPTETTATTQAAGDENAAAATANVSAESSEPAAAEAPPITLELADGATYQQTLESLRGKVVLVDFWATWCPPCMKQFPHTVEFSEKYSGEGLAVISVSLDDPEKSEESVRTFLQKQNAQFTNLISRHGAGLQSMEEFDITGGVPHYKLYDRSGQERHRFSSTPMESDGTKPIEQIEPLLQELLAEPAA